MIDLLKHRTSGQWFNKLVRVWPGEINISQPLQHKCIVWACVFLQQEGYCECVLLLEASSKQSEMFSNTWGADC